MYFDHFPWQIYGCGTYRESPTEGHAKASFKSFLDRLERGLERQPVACIAVLEGRTSGRRSSPTPRHWHFIKAAPRRYEDALLSSVPQLWEKAYGNCKTQAYDPRLPGGSYMAKTAKNADFDWLMHNLEHLCPGQNLDLFAQQQTDPYVPDHVRGLTRGQTLVMRPVCEISSATRAAESNRPQPRGVSRNIRGSHGRHL